MILNELEIVDNIAKESRSIASLSVFIGCLFLIMFLGLLFASIGVMWLMLPAGLTFLSMIQKIHILRKNIQNSKLPVDIKAFWPNLELKMLNVYNSSIVFKGYNKDEKYDELQRLAISAICSFKSGPHQTYFQKVNKKDFIYFNWKNDVNETLICFDLSSGACRGTIVEQDNNGFARQNVIEMKPTINSLKLLIVCLKVP